MEKPVTDRNSWMVGLVAGGLIGAMASCGLGGFGVFMLAKREYKKARAGWVLKPVIVYNQDLAAGSPITFEVVSQRPLPEQFVTGSVVKPDQASSIITARVTKPVAAGDPVRWQDLVEGTTAEECQKACAWTSQVPPEKSKPIREALEKLKPEPEARP